MEWISPGELDAGGLQVDALAQATPDVDVFCTSTPWLLAAHTALMPPRAGWVWRTPAGVILLARGQDPLLGTYLQPLEAVWGFSAPAVGRDPEALAESLVAAFRSRRDDWQVLLLSGVVAGSPLFRGLVRGLVSRHRLALGPETGRCAASLDGGLDGFLARRSARLRANLRRARRRAVERGVRFEWVTAAEPRAFFDRVLAVERSSWKGVSGVGIQSGPMLTFYRRMVPLLVARGALRALFAVRDGTDLAYVFGGRLGDTYRGLQMSYDLRESALSLGDVCQVELIERLCAEGARVYDMGQEIDYKHRWTEGGLRTVTLVVQR